MTTLIRRHSSPVEEMLGWLDSENFFKGFGLTSYVRLEDFVDDDTYVLRAEMPGIDPDKDVHIDVDGDTLTIEGERREESKERNRHELHYGSFSRSVTLPRHADVDDIKAEYKNGILEVRVPMAAGEKSPVRVAIEHGA